MEGLETKVGQRIGTAEVSDQAHLEQGPKIPKARDVEDAITAANKARTVERNRAGAESGDAEGAKKVADGFFSKIRKNIAKELNDVMWDAERGSRSLPLDQRGLDISTWLTIWPGLSEIATLESFQSLKIALEARGYTVYLNGGQYSSINRGTHVLEISIVWASASKDAHVPPATGDIAAIPLASEVRSRIAAANLKRSQEAAAGIAGTQQEGNPLDPEVPEQKAKLLEAGKGFLRKVVFSVGQALRDAVRDSQRTLHDRWSDRVGLYTLENDLQPFITWFGTDPSAIIDDLKASEEFRVLTTTLTKAGYETPSLTSYRSNLYDKAYTLRIESVKAA